MAENKQNFHFTIGPVQSFVGQARRTNDFWAGSFILSWLSGVAMVCVQKASGEILFPKPDKAFLQAIQGNKTDNLPQQGSLPNRFKAKVPHDFDPSQITKAVQQAWSCLCQLIYDGDIAPIFSQSDNNLSIDKQEVTDLWQKQVEHFWQMQWVLTHSDEHSVLDQRKNWRNTYTPPQYGVKCSLMGEWQELSGVLGVFKKDSENRQAFWDKLKKSCQNDIKQGEYLCAMAWVKRRFAHYFETLKCSLSIEKQTVDCNGWQVKQGFSSVADLAAFNWRTAVLKQSQTDDDLKEKIKRFVTQAKKLSDDDSKDLMTLDGHCCFDIALENVNMFTDTKQAQKVNHALQAIKKHVNLSPSPFYAALMMDGDSLGKQMSDPTKQKAITEGLGEFTSQVGEIVQTHHGLLIYAGGDDVLALLPMESALTCTHDIHKKYDQCFKENSVETSISAAVIFSHIYFPFSNVLADLHHLLDDIAKEQTGRNAIAISDQKQSGQHFVWASKWQTDSNRNNLDIVQELNAVVDTLTCDEPNYSNSFLYNLVKHRAVLESTALETTDIDSGNLDGKGLNEKQKKSLILSQYLQSYTDKKQPPSQEAIDRLYRLMKQKNGYSLSGLYLACFLAQYKLVENYKVQEACDG